VPSSKSKRIESRKGVLSRKDSGITKNSFYRSRQNPDVLPNKPTVPAAYGQEKENPYNKQALPTLSNPYQSSVARNSGYGNRGGMPLAYKYNPIGGGIASNPYQMH